jgi:hypothetical protein
MHDQEPTMKAQQETTKTRAFDPAAQEQDRVPWQNQNRLGTPLGQESSTEQGIPQSIFHHGTTTKNRSQVLL